MVPILVSIVLLAACGGAAVDTTAASTYTNLSVLEMQTKLEAQDVLSVNVHVPFAGDIPGTDLSIPYDQIEQNLDLLPADKGADIVIYCRSGNMSRIASETLVNLGYTNVSNFEGGMNAWQEAGLPLIGMNDQTQ